MADQQSKVDTILGIITFALQGLALIPGLPGGIAVGVAIEQTLQGILSKALAAYHAEVGAPLDLAKIPLQTPYAANPVAVGPAPAKNA